MKAYFLASALLFVPAVASAGNSHPTTPAPPVMRQGQGQGQGQSQQSTNVNNNSARAGARAVSRSAARAVNAGNNQSTVFKYSRNTMWAPTTNPSANVCGDSSISVALLDLAAFGATYGKRWCEVLAKADVFFKMGQYQLGYAMLARDPDFYAVFQGQGLIVNQHTGNIVRAKN